MYDMRKHIVIQVIVSEWTANQRRNEEKIGRLSSFSLAGDCQAH